METNRIIANMKVWSIPCSTSSLAALARLRLLPNILVYADSENIWIRGDVDEENDRLLRALPGITRWEQDDQGQLYPPGGYLPRAKLPVAQWTPLKDWIKVERPKSTWAGQLGNRITLQLVPASKTMPVALLLTDWETWCQYVVNAPQARLDRWSFAVHQSGHTLIKGTPLPSIRGNSYILEDGIALPAGMDFDPPIDAKTLYTTLSRTLADKHLFFWDHPAGCLHGIAESSFVRASRSAVRATNKYLTLLKHESGFPHHGGRKS